MPTALQTIRSLAAKLSGRSVRATDPGVRSADLPHGDARGTDAQAAALIAVLANPEADAFDVVQAQDALEAIPAPPVEPLLEGFGRTRDPVVRRRLAPLLGSVTVRDDRVRDALVELLADDPVAGASALRGYGDRSVVPALARALDAAELEGPPSYPDADLDEPHEDVYRLAGAITGLGGALSPAQQAKLHEALRRRDAWFEETFGELPPALKTAPPRPTPRLGRNAPCHCGSGRKYKKCHLEADAAAA